MKTIEEAVGWLNTRIQKAEKIITDWKIASPIESSETVITAWLARQRAYRETLEFIEGSPGFKQLGEFIEAGLPK